MSEIEFCLAAATRLFNQEYVPLQCAHMDQKMRRIAWVNLCKRLELEGKISAATRYRWTR